MSSKNARVKLQRALDLLVDDVMQLSDGDLVADAAASEEGLEALTACAASAIDGALRKAGRERLAAARIQLAKRRASPVGTSAVDITRARRLYDSIRDRKAALVGTLAARNGSELTDQQILDILKDWLALGAISQEDLEK